MAAEIRAADLVSDASVRRARDAGHPLAYSDVVIEIKIATGLSPDAIRAELARRGAPRPDTV